MGMSTSKKGILLIGAGALARDIVDCFGAGTFIAAYVDPKFAVAAVGVVPMVTDWDEARRRASHYVLGVSDIAHRERARNAAAAAGLLPAAPLVSSLARVAGDAQLAPGCMVGHFAVIGPAARLGVDTLLMHAAIVAHDSSVEEGSVLCAGACINGNAAIGPRCFVGPNAVVLPNVRIGHDSFVAAGAVCFRDAPARSFLLGNPARRRTPPKPKPSAP